MIPFRLFAAPVVVLVAFAAAAFADDDPARVTGASAEPATASPGGRVSLRVDVEVDDPYHVYGLAETTGLPPKFVAPKGGWPEGLTPGTPTESPEPKKVVSSGIESLVHHGKVSFTLPFTVAAEAKPGAREIAGEIELQVCDEKQCLLPKKFPFSATLQVAEPEKVRIVRTAFVPPTVAPGADATLEIEFAIAKGWHLYAQRHAEYRPPTIKWTLPPGWTAKDEIVEVTPPHEIDFFGEKLFVHEEKCVLRQTISVAKDAALGTVELKGLGAWQRCDETMCMDDKDVPVAATLTIGGAAVPADGQQAAPSPPPKADPAPSPAPAKDAAAQTLWGTLLSGIGWGLITILTPCVFPMLPVTVSFFSKQKGPALPRSIAYAFGIIFTITVIGLIFKGGLDLFARGSFFNLLVGLLFIVLAMSLFGLFELGVPSFLIDKSQERGAAGGLVGAFFMAVTLALTSFACSVPFLAIMFSRFDKGEVAQSVIGLLAYSATVALPFFLCSLFPSLLKAMPKSGGWLNAVKVTMGFVEFGLAFKFLRTVAINEGSDMLPRSLLLALWTACALAAALYLFGYITLPHDTKTESIGVVRLMFALMFLTMALYFVPGMFGRPLNSTLDGFIQTDASEIVAAADPGGGAPIAARTEWTRNDWDGALARAAEKKRPVLFDFTGVG